MEAIADNQSAWGEGRQDALERLGEKLALIGLLLTSSACGSRTGLDAGGTAPIAPVCAAQSFPCVRPSDDPCGPSTVEDAVCDEPSGRWACAAGARPYARASDSPATCLPFHGDSSVIHRLGGSLVRVPTDDGRCLWVAEEVETDAGTVQNIAFDPDLAAPFGTCPSGAPLLDDLTQSSVEVAGASDPSIEVQITGAYRFSGTTRVPYRLFRVDPGAVFGLTELGTGIGRWDGARRRIVVGGAAALRFPTDVDLGDDSMVLGGYAYLWGCPVLAYLSRQCLLGRIDASDSMQLFVGDGRWSAGAAASDGVPVFSGGPWIASVTTDIAGGGFLHIFAPEFGSTVQLQRASQPEGPWTAPSALASCDLPAADRGAFCMGPVVHTELGDPTRPAELVVSYNVKTTASAPLPDVDAYWSRLAWIVER
jgi:hypothetical protein